jgi:hypothetical protein
MLISSMQIFWVPYFYFLVTQVSIFEPCGFYIDLYIHEDKVDI